jgi:hypothetical protein
LTHQFHEDATFGYRVFEGRELQFGERVAERRQILSSRECVGNKVHRLFPKLRGDEKCVDSFDESARHERMLLSALEKDLRVGSERKDYWRRQERPPIEKAFCASREKDSIGEERTLFPLSSSLVPRWRG